MVTFMITFGEPPLIAFAYLPMVMSDDFRKRQVKGNFKIRGVLNLLYGIMVHTPFIINLIIVRNINKRDNHLT